MYSQSDKDILRQIARRSVHNGLLKHKPLAITITDYPEVLQKQRATFVTLNINNELRGCIGTLTPYRALVDDIAHNAYSAAFSDPRFPELSHREFELLDYHISVLSETSPLTFASEQDLLSQLRPDIDGLVLEDNGHRGTFLPSVWEQLPEPEQFLAHLKLKAGLASGYWSDTLKISRYTVEAF
jgi:AmmeMemoRadiSam system protein A